MGGRVERPVGGGCLWGALWFIAGSTLGRTRAITDYSSVKVAEENVRTWENVCDVMISEKKVTKQDIEFDPYFVTLAGKTPTARCCYPCRLRVPCISSWSLPV